MIGIRRSIQRLNINGLHLQQDVYNYRYLATSSSFKIKVKPTSLPPISKQNQTSIPKSNTFKSIPKSNPILSSSSTSTPITSPPQQQSNSQVKQPIINSTSNSNSSNTSINQSSSQVKSINNNHSFNQNGGSSTTKKMITQDDVINYLDKKSLAYRISGQEIIIKECPFCPDTKGKADNQWKLYISREACTFFCHRCANKGSWYDFRSNMGDPINTHQHQESNITSYADMKRMASYAPELLNNPDIIKKLTGNEEGERGLDLEVCKLYNVGVTNQSFFVDDKWEEQKCITFPWTVVDKKGAVQVVRCKLRSLKSKANQRIEPKGGKFGFFGWHTIPQDCKEIVMTEGEYDAMAVYQATGIPSISLPNGALSFPLLLVPQLERFEKIYLWMDDDAVGQEGAIKVAEKLGIQRTYIVRSKLGNLVGPKDANDALRQGFDLNQIIDAATIVPHTQISNFKSKEEEEKDINGELKDSFKNIKSQWIPLLNQLIQLRGGEITLVSGTTGVGKTTLASQLALDYALQDVKTLYGSFETPLSRTKDLIQHQIDDQHDKLDQIHFQFLKFFGSTPLSQLIDAIQYAINVNNVKHIVLDDFDSIINDDNNNQSNHQSYNNKYQSSTSSSSILTTTVLEKLRLIATTKNVHFTIIVQPTTQNHTITLNNIKESLSKIDNIILLQKSDEYRYLDIKKSRSTGNTGIIPLEIDQDWKRYKETSIDNL